MTALRFFCLFVLLMPISPLLTVFGFLSGRAGPVSPCNVFLLLRFGFHLATLLPGSPSASERNPILQYRLKIVFFTHRSMVKKSHSRECHCNTVFVAGHDDMVVTHRASCLRNKLHTTLVGTLDIVAEGEESI